ncbi:unnamed protein product [Linum trigynum]|uniref:Uncharacterized protein n=1 Tax=Linum trigynum TaxID=586398 RepID=A0AAV2GSK6_9ROSI
MTTTLFVKPREVNSVSQSFEARLVALFGHASGGAQQNHMVFKITSNVPRSRGLIKFEDSHELPHWTDHDNDQLSLELH